MGVAWFMVGDYGRAVFYFEKCLAVQPGNLDALSMCGQAYCKLQHPDAANRLAAYLHSAILPTTGLVSNSVWPCRDSVIRSEVVNNGT